ncbi:hypothetical protein ACF1BE_32275 [Streptomyces sp. NPDC014991]|uniref:hypothetical protein n=1 Tax=Streptomyces sp. NPDC014991 TaxID=3364935 RepID=UPI0036F9C82B
MPGSTERQGVLDSADRIAIKSVCAIVPGYGPSGEEFGTLVPTDRILAGIRPARLDPRKGELPVSFLKDKLGIESVATTHTTAATSRAMIDSGLDWNQAAATIPTPPTNPDIITMLTRAMDTALSRHEQTSGRHAARDQAIAGHLHFAAVNDSAPSFAVLDCRRAAGCHKPGLPGEVLFSGCAGLLVALRHARFLLRHTEARHDPDAYVLITAVSDLLPFAHTRALAPAALRADIDAWLFQAIFGEGVGAMVVGHADMSDQEWLVEDAQWQAVADDWRVTLTGDSVPRMTIRARDVGTTFRTSIPGVAQQGLGALGLSSFDALHRLCVHESNPQLVAAVSRDLDTPDNLVHSISSQVGTLAGVSVFTLLEEAFRTHQQASDPRDAIACALIGESGNAVIAGHLALRRTNTAPES